MNDPGHYDEDESLETELVGQQPWSLRTQRIARILWSSFVAAVIGTLVSFMFIDPELLGVALMPEREISVLTGYGLCFFFFWFVALLSSGTTMFLGRSHRKEHE
jgi:hypothetical protein